VLLLVILFRTSSNLASAYVLAVAATEFTAGPLGFIVFWKLWRWPLWGAALLMVPFIIVDATFLVAAMMKLVEGAWVPVLFGILMILVIWTWRRGTIILANKTRRTEVPLATLIQSLEKKPPPIVPGTAVFLTSDPEFAPTALLHNLKHNKVLHEHNVILTIVTLDTPRAPEEERVTFLPLSQHFSRVTLKFHRAQARLDVRHHVNVVLPLAPFAQASEEVGHAALAGPSVHRHGALRQRCDGLFPDSHRPRRRGGHAGDRLTGCGPLSP
jgi:KUP system potassium uptake protein